MSSVKDLHIDVKVTGEREKVGLFHYLMAQCDGDWPYTRRNAQYAAARKKCKKCGGFVYNSSVMVAGDVKALGRQVGVETLVRAWKPAKKCEKNGHVETEEVVLTKDFYEES
jgi:hypothetical protein